MGSLVQRTAATVLVVLASGLAFLSVYAVWARQQVLDGPTWADTSTQIVQDAQVRTALATALADRLVANAGARTALARQLLTPEQQAAAATGTTDALRAAIDVAAQRALTTPAVKRAWRTTNLAAQRELVLILDGRSSTVSTHGGTVTLDLRQIVRLLAGTVSLPATVVDGLPDRTTTLVVMHSGDLAGARDVLRSIRGLSIVLPAFTLLLWVLALLAAPRHRRSTLVQISASLFLVAVAVLITRSAAGDAVLDALAVPAADRAAAEQAWSIGTSLLRNAAIVVLVLAVLVIPLAMLAGPGEATTRWGRERDEETELLDQLSALVELHDTGAIGDAEYHARRRRLLADGHST